MNDEHDFYAWIVGEIGYTDKSSRDIVCHLKRVNKYIKVDKRLSSDALEKKLEDQPEFKAMSISVKCQLRRAIRFYIQFVNSE